jgi:hypothetical protein
MFDCSGCIGSVGMSMGAFSALLRLGLGGQSHLMWAVHVEMRWEELCFYFPRVFHHSIFRTLGQVVTGATDIPIYTMTMLPAAANAMQPVLPATNRTAPRPRSLKWRALNRKRTPLASTAMTRNPGMGRSRRDTKSFGGSRLFVIPSSVPHRTSLIGRCPEAVVPLFTRRFA